MGFSLADPIARPLLARYTGGEARRRYYQDAAIRAVLEKIAAARRPANLNALFFDLLQDRERLSSQSTC